MTQAPQQKPLGAQISHMLKSRGVDVIFGIPGVHNQEMYRGIEEAGISHVLARHEQGAGFMADGYARATGRPGVAYVITGPGLTNIMTALGQATSDSASVLAISSCLNFGDLGMGKTRLHEMQDQEIAAGTVCDWSKTALTAQSAYALIDRAFGEFASARGGAKHMQVPIELLEANATAAPNTQAKPADPAMAPDTVLGDVAARLMQAQKPVIIFGGGAAGADVGAVQSLLELSAAASFTTYAGRGIVSADAPLHFGSYLARPSSAQIMAEADLVIAIGTCLAEVDLWRDHLGHRCPMIRVDIDPAVLYDGHRAEVPVLSDAAGFIGGVVARLTQDRSDWRASQVAGQRALWRAEIEAERPGLLRVIDALWAAVPDDAMIFSDMTQFAYAAKEVWDMPKPGHWHHPTGFGTLGFALPAAIGGAMGRAGLPTIAIAGDYGFQYTVQELGTAAEMGLPLPIILWDNGKLKEIEESMQGAQIAPNAVIARNPDFGLLARAYGIGFAEPAKLADIPAALAGALKAKGPTIIRLTPAIRD